MSTLRINQLVFGLRAGVLGATDNRMGVWTQGCSLPKCPGCTSTHTWSPEAGKAVSVDFMLRLALAQPQPPAGLTVSGGEPTDQAPQVEELVRGFREAFPNTEVVLYSGLRWPVLQSRHTELVSLLDVAIAGPYVRTMASTPLAGSGNQEVRLLTPMAERLYQRCGDWSQHLLQVGRGGPAQVVTVGIPNTRRMKQAARQTGVVAATWDRRRTRNDHG